MKILAISGSPRDPQTSNCYQLVERVAKATGLEYELISLHGKKIHGCIACQGCVKDNVCVVNDDMAALREKFVEADAIIFGASNYYSTMNTMAAAVLERWFQFRHQAADTLWGKLAVAVGVGGSNGDEVADQIEHYMLYNFVETVASVSGQGPACCFSCGYGETCKVGAPHMLYGPNVKITEEITPNVSKQPEVLKAADEAGKLLAERLKNHDRKEVARRMQVIMIERFKESV